MPEPQLQCSEMVTSSERWSHSYPCHAKGAKKRDDGKVWCGRHDPKAVKERAAKADAKFDAEWDEAQKQRRIRSEKDRLYDYVLGYSSADPLFRVSIGDLRAAMRPEAQE